MNLYRIEAAVSYLRHTETYTFFVHATDLDHARGIALELLHCHASVKATLVPPGEIFCPLPTKSKA